MKPTTLNIPLPVLNALQRYVEDGMFHSRSHAVRDCLVEFLMKEKEYLDYLKTFPETCHKSIISVNLEVKDIKFAIENLVDISAGGIFPSMSELVRVAVRDFLVKEKHIREFPQFTPLPKRPSSYLIDEDGIKYNLNDKRNAEREVYV